MALNVSDEDVGTDIWAYGISGPDQGLFSAAIDNVIIGQYSGYADSTDYHHLLFTAHGLPDGPEHYLTLSSVDGSSLAFDVAIINSAAAFTP